MGWFWQGILLDEYRASKLGSAKFSVHISVLKETAISPSTRPLVTIGIPVRNGQKFIREGLESILAQTMTDFEVVICDNDSSDFTPAICQEFAGLLSEAPSEVAMTSNCSNQSTRALRRVVCSSSLLLDVASASFSPR